ncbi:hypothetical protein Rhopal_007059-T1 [Rhodotorula paludigena]|uniref:ATP synthase complex subunit H-domain-containing protein n=1 Tax=Rhodotorula paludigena TaxID=86838 RepID=A0AAV5GNS8_9BASI|nr:hypothetical protein Rhopal_007059-T1 [Rhodotorula paludigena]
MFARRAVQVAPVRKDFVQELYLKELRAYKPKPAASAQGATKSYSTPAAPKAPEVPDAASLAKELEAYDASAPVTDAPSTGASAADVASEEDALGADDYLKLCEEPIHAEKH